MRKVLLADDEEVILEGLEKLIDWEELGLEIVGTAKNGKEELELIEALSPDIVISDVRMPKLTGTEVLEKVSSEGYEGHVPKFIFVSAYEEFSYIKKAMSFGAVDYLLKPVRANDLKEVLAKALKDIENLSTLSIFREDPDEKRLREVFRELNDGYEYASRDIYEAFRRMNIDTDGKVYLGVCAGIVEENDPDMPYEKSRLLRFVVYNKIVEHFTDKGEGFVIRKDDSSCNLVAVIDEDGKKDFLAGIWDLISAIEDEYSLKVCFGIGRKTNDAAGLIECYNSARFARDLYYFEPRSVIDMANVTIPEIEEDGGIGEFNRLCEDVFSGIASHNPSLVLNIRKVLAKIRKMHYGNRSAAISLCMSFTGSLHERLYSYGMVKGGFSRYQEKMLKDMEEQATFGELADFLSGYYETIIPQIYENEKSRDVSAMADIKKYLKENYMNDISLKELADMMCVSPSYFSTLFKNTTGENYKSFLINIRLEEAIKLVLSTDLKTYQLAERVGYNNVRRFVDAFKNKYGVSPTEYRKLYQK